MKDSTYSLSAWAVLIGLLLPTLDAQAEVLEANEKLQWRRGNLHTHSLWSDGEYPLKCQHCIWLIFTKKVHEWVHGHFRCKSDYRAGRAAVG